MLRNVVGEYWVDQTGLNGMGAMVVFAYEANTLEDDGTRVYRNAIANARIYNDTELWERDPDGHGFVEVPTTYGQQMPGVAWYNLADPAAIGDDFDFTYMILTGGEETARYRYNLGLLNASDPQTLITVSLQAFQPNGEPYLDDQGDPLITVQTVPILAHLQWYRAFSTLWDLEEVEAATIKVSFAAWSSTAPDPIPAPITYGSLIDEVGWEPGAARAAVSALLAEVGLGDRGGTFPDRLSGGEQQRVAIARALVHVPMLVLAGDPTGPLDAETGRKVLDLSGRLLRERGKTLLIVTHSKEVTRFAERVLTLEDGQLTAHALEAVW